MDEKDWDRFRLSYVDIDGCWIWIRSRFRDGYGAATIAGKTKRAHRVSYEMFYNVSLSRENLIHHICKNKACVNPQHLEITTQYTHIDSATYGNKEKTYCPHGHKYTPENTYWNRGGRNRECLQCKLIRSRRQYKRNKAAVAARIKAIAEKYKQHPDRDKS